MQDQREQSAPRRLLRRASNLLTSNGHLSPKVKQFIDDRSPSPLKSPNKLKLSTSIKRKFKEVKDGALFRSRSSTEVKPHSVSVVNVNSVSTPTQQVPRLSLDSKMQSISLTKDRLPSVPDAPNVQPRPLTEAPEASVTETGMGDVTVPQLLQQGTPMTKVSAKERKRAVFRLDPDIGQIIWESKKHRISESTFFIFFLD